MPRQSSMRGFTLIELMIILILLSIVIGIAIPNLSRLIRNHQIETQAQTLNSLLQFARTEAVVGRTSVTLANNANNWTVTRGGQTLRTETFDPEQATIASSEAPTNITFLFNGTATPTPTPTLTICHDNNPVFAYQLSVQPSGHSRLSSRGKKTDGTDLGDCNP
jgi:type IV fimbrial biogenesis protein FimU